MNGIVGLFDWVLFAWRNLWRHRKRTLLAVTVLTFSIATILFMLAVQQGSYDALIRASTQSFDGLLQIQTDLYSQTGEFGHVLEDAEQLKKHVRAQVSKNDALGLRLYSPALGVSGDRSTGVFLIGVETEIEPLLSTLPQNIQQGRYLDPKKPWEVVIGATLAKRLALQPGKDISLLAQDLEGGSVAFVAQVVGIFETGYSELDDRAVEIRIKDFREAFYLNTQQAHALVVSGPQIAEVPALKEKLRPLLSSGQRILTMKDLQPGITQLISLDMASGWVYYLSIVFIALFATANTFLMSLMERRREFGVILSIGAHPRQVLVLVFFELLLVLGLGIVLGTLIGSALVGYYHAVGFVIPGSEQLAATFHVSPVIHPNLSLFVLAPGPLSLLIMGLLSLAYPLMKLLKLDPLQCLK